MSQINEFQPNPPGQDPDMQMFELFGTPNATFDGWIITIESDDGNSQLGLVDSANLVSGTFDADGLLTVEIPGFENPGFTIALLDGTNGFTGTAGVTDLDTDNDGVADDVSTLGTVLDAIGVPDSTADEATLYGVQLGGTDFSFTGAEPELIFRESTLGDLYAVNLLDVNGGGDVFDTSGVAVLPGTFATDPSTGTTFGAANPGFGTTAPANFTLELLHFTDQEANASTIDNIDNLSAVLTALRDQDLGDDGVADNTLTLSSGDVIIPGLFFDASEVVFGAAGIADIQIQNELGLQAAALGNHEFDLGTAFLADLISGTTAVTNDNGTPDDPSDDFVEEVPLGNFDALTGTALDGLDFTGAAFPYLSANLGFDTDPNLAPLEVAGGQAPLGNVVTSSTVIEEGGEQIGVVGATVPTIDSISSAGSDIGIFPEDFDSNPTDAQLDALAAILQAEVDALLAANPNLNKVIVLSHMQQISIEEGLAERLDGVDIIVAGGSNTRLFDDNDRIRDGDSDQGQYPTFITNPGGTFTAVVNTDAQYKYVGRLVIDFDADGNIIPSSYDEDVSGAYATDDLGVVELGFETFDPFEMSEDQEVGTTPPDTAATGSVTLDAINGTTGEVTISGTFSGLTDANESNALFPVGGVDSAGNPESAIHLHNAAAGENGPIVRNFTVTDNGDGSGSFTGTFTLTAGEIASLVAGETYVNLHTTDFNGGQLRGQVDIPEAVEMSGLIDPEVDAITDAIQAQIVATESNVFGVSDVFLNGNRFGDLADPTDPDGVRTQETNLGNLTADANLVYANQMIEANDLGDPVVVSIKNGGGIRANIGEIVVPGGGTEAVRQPNSSVVDENGVVVKPEGGISQNDIASTLAFNNGLALLDITKAELVAVLEEGVGALPNISGGFPQVSGVKFSFDPDLPTGERIVSAGIFDENDELVAELVSNGEIVGDQTEVFRIVTLDFLADGGDPILSALSSPNRVDLEDLDADGIDDGASTGAATFSIDGTEQDALAEYLNDNFNPDNGGTAFNEADTGRDTDGRIQNLAFREDDVLPAPTNPEAPVATGDVEVAIYAEFDSGVGADGAEVVAHEDGVLYVTNGETGAIDVFEIPETAAPGTAAAPTSSIDLTGLPGFDGVQSVAVKNGLIAVAISRATEAATIFGTEVELSQNGFVALFDTETLTLQATLDVGVLPDQLAFSADGSQLYVAGEGEKNDDSDNDDNPLGTVALIDLDLQGDLADSTVNLVDFTQFNGFEELAREAGIRVQEGVSIAEDLEPEYVAVSPDGETIFVSLQENNAIAKIDVATGEVEEIFSLGLQDHSLPGNEIDPLDNGVPEIRNFDNLVSFRMADAIASFEIDGQTYVATANEGDSRGFDEDRVEDLAEDGLLDPDLEAQLRADGLLDDDGDTDVGLERLEVSTIDGDTDGDGDIDVIHSFSSRSFSIFDEDGNLVFDSGSEFEAIIAELAPERFNDDDGDEGEDRSDAKGPEPEAIAIGEVGGRDYAFIGLERDSGIMIYDVSDPANSFFVNYIPPLFVNDAGDGEIAKQGPEIITVIGAEESATGNAQIAVSYEISGTTIVYDLTPTSPLVE
ncbi:MAG: choice-of-anchor I family protein, partial [Pseudomonadota bacterium]